MSALTQIFEELKVVGDSFIPVIKGLGSLLAKFLDLAADILRKILGSF